MASRNKPQQPVYIPVNAHVHVEIGSNNENSDLFRIFIPGVLLLHYPHITICSKFFFNATSQMQVTSGPIPLQNGFDFSFRTCSGGVLLDQRGTSSGFFRLEVVPTTVKLLSYTSVIN
ncbi:hypothetical protein OS493_024810 [Desmophyllum pertusum]|uniref:Uncharacterized protein n=1 Tax=Desmophyllum pertusum TaxID=174260 RepID=A0A9W9ZB69_9CNID|nr:hypothetical protein OS493_024810 [Desmophyllum pertusum]